jgi:hypothetical protein
MQRKKTIHDIAAAYTALVTTTAALQEFCKVAQSWHQLHCATTVPCDNFCDALAAGKAALQGANAILENGFYREVRR